MFNLGVIGSIASIVGLIAAVRIALYQRKQALKAREEAEVEKARVASLQDHLTRQQWQHLRSLGQQIDTLEAEGRCEETAVDAAMHARLKEQYRSLLGVVATSTQGFCTSTVRNWVAVGRLPRPWQVAEAISYLELSSADGQPSDEGELLKEFLDSTRAVPKVAAVQPPTAPTAYVAVFVLVAHSVRDPLKKLLSDRTEEPAAAVLLDYLAQDCLEMGTLDKIGGPHFKTWGAEKGASLQERFQYYNSQDFWIILEASERAQAKLSGFENLFEEISGDYPPKMLIPKMRSVEAIRSKFPKVAEAALRLFEQQGLVGNK